MALVPADRAFAHDYAKRLQGARAFADDYVKKAAYQIDYLIGSTLVAKGQKFNAPATDEQFVRRLYLDAIGPHADGGGSRAFLADTAPDKRAKLIDKLLHSPGYTMQMYNWLGDMLRVKDTFGKKRAGLHLRGLAEGSAHRRSPVGCARAHDAHRRWQALRQRRRRLPRSTTRRCRSMACRICSPLSSARMSPARSATIIRSPSGRSGTFTRWRRSSARAMASTKAALQQAKKLAKGKGERLRTAQRRRCSGSRAPMSYRMIDTDRSRT